MKICFTESQNPHTFTIVGYSTVLPAQCSQLVRNAKWGQLQKEISSLDSKRWQNEAVTNSKKLAHSFPLSTHSLWAPFSASAPALPHTERHEFAFQHRGQRSAGRRGGTGSQNARHSQSQIFTEHTLGAGTLENPEIYVILTFK